MNPAIVVFKKELRDMFRDKRVRSSAFLMPILLIVGILFLFGSVIGGLTKPSNVRIHAVRSDSELLTALRKNEVNITEVESLARGQEMVRTGEARLLLDFNERQVEGVSQTVVDAYFDPDEQRGKIDLAAISETFREANKAAAQEFLKLQGLPTGALEMVKVNQKPLKVSKGGAAELIVSMVPYLIIVWAFWGGMGIVSDLVAGEKEKNTLETLLITPVRRTQIVFGKFLALSVVCLLSSLSSLVGLLVYAVIKPPGSSEMLEGGLGLSPMSVGVTLAVLIPTVALFASVLIAVSTYARNTREAQTHLSVLSFIVIMPAIFVQLLGLTDLGKQMWINFVPVLNTGANIRAAFLGKMDVLPILVTVVTSLLIAGMALKIAISLFNREEVLTRV